MIDVLQNVALAPLTTLKIGGNARFFVVAKTESDVVEAFEFAQKNNLEIFVLGGGSNVLISDQGFDGLVLKISLKGIFLSAELPADSSLVTASAGEDWDQLVAYCVELNLAGIECLSGIPGYVGGTPVQNVGAYGQEVSETIVSVRCFDRTKRAVVTLTNGDCGFSYRTSIFNSTMRELYVVLSVTFELQQGAAAKPVYKDLVEYFYGRQPSLSEVREAVISIRRSKSMVIDAADPNSKSAGSFFKNPVVERMKLDEIRKDFPQVPSFDFGDKVKIPAAWLIENAGFNKGFVCGSAGISTKHPLALINRSNASAEEMIVLKDMIQTAVNQKFGIALKPEPVFVGFN